MSESNPLPTTRPIDDESLTDVKVDLPKDEVMVRNVNGLKLYILPADGIVTGGREGITNPEALMKLSPEERAKALRRLVTPNDNMVSRDHFALNISENGITVADLGSREGTFLNGRRLFGPPVESDLGPTHHPLAEGDLIALADRIFFRVKKDKQSSRWVIEQEFTPAKRLSQEVLANGTPDLVRRGEIAFEAIPQSKTLTELSTYAEISMPYFMEGFSEEATESALARFRYGLDLIIGKKPFPKGYEPHSQNDMLLSALAELVHGKDGQWVRILDTAKTVINNERQLRGLVPLNFSDEPESMQKLYEYRADYVASPEKKVKVLHGGKSIPFIDETNPNRENQDAWFSLGRGSTAVFDGVSNAYDGAQSAQIAAEAYKETLKELPLTPTSQQVEDAYQLAQLRTIQRYQQAEADLRMEQTRYIQKFNAGENPDLGNLDSYLKWKAKNETLKTKQSFLAATMASATLIHEDGYRKVVVAHSGDARAYAVTKDGKLRSLTIDHNMYYGQENARQLQEKFDAVTDESTLSPEEKALFDIRNHISQDLSDGIEHGNIESTVQTYVLKDDEVGVVCMTDGVHDNLTLNDAEMTLQTEDPETQKMSPVVEPVVATAPDAVEPVPPTTNVVEQPTIPPFLFKDMEPPKKEGWTGLAKFRQTLDKAFTGFKEFKRKMSAPKPVEKAAVDKTIPKDNLIPNEVLAERLSYLPGAAEIESRKIPMSHVRYYEQNVTGYVRPAPEAISYRAKPDDKSASPIS